MQRKKHFQLKTYFGKKMEHLLLSKAFSPKGISSSVIGTKDMVFFSLCPILNLKEYGGVLL
ncbi:Hypothetical protein Minf_1100 [Methylacidiphilum infernorum V4]|uniref:Uncharacterized protein n=1 Tax=Methylacidiphilum infernorum (isolate V4) TaxID=481448 RepID=B3DV02_METI4|nr:Hypothetical protein Minf_1100 [Methylacidiphilum infernorum V4]